MFAIVIAMLFFLKIFDWRFICFQSGLEAIALSRLDSDEAHKPYHHANQGLSLFLCDLEQVIWLLSQLTVSLCEYGHKNTQNADKI